jgi:hypothetical protein
MQRQREPMHVTWDDIGVAFLVFCAFMTGLYI